MSEQSSGNWERKEKRDNRHGGRKALYLWSNPIREGGYGPITWEVGCIRKAYEVGSFWGNEKGRIPGCEQRYSVAASNIYCAAASMLWCHVSLRCSIVSKHVLDKWIVHSFSFSPGRLIHSRTFQKSQPSSNASHSQSSYQNIFVIITCLQKW